VELRIGGEEWSCGAGLRVGAGLVPSDLSAD
jgi:hypothetical protein